MTDENKGPTAWRDAFESLIEAAQQPAWRTTPPRFVVKQGRFGEFTACTKYPECKYVKHKTTGVKCPNDGDEGGEIVERKSRRGKLFFGCSRYPDCDFVLWNRPVAETCPACGAPFLIEKTTKKHGRQVLCHRSECDYSRSEELVETV